VFGQILAPVCAGLVVGIAATLPLQGVLRGAVFGIATFDPASIVAAVVLLGLVASAAAYVPARRVTRLDPLRVLRQE
jgi:putative ABC transport system permease protein